MRHKGNEEGRGGENWRETGRGTVREGLGRRRVLPGCWGAAMERKEKRRRWAKRWQLRKGTIWRFPVLGDRFGRVSVFRRAEGVLGSAVQRTIMIVGF